MMGSYIVDGSSCKPAGDVRMNQGDPERDSPFAMRVSRTVSVFQRNSSVRARLVGCWL